MCYETDNTVKRGTADEIKISYTIVQDDDDIYPVKRGIWWNLSNVEEFKSL